ncbi:hypothetical protein HZA33_05125 [Candidatus Pacearchaeota archaeon]|nr:hypothetical protein [Candidatus Pacearchaeota archaeon]
MERKRAQEIVDTMVDKLEKILNVQNPYSPSPTPYYYVGSAKLHKVLLEAFEGKYKLI